MTSNCKQNYCQTLRPLIMLSCFHSCFIYSSMLWGFFWAKITSKNLSKYKVLIRSILKIDRIFWSIQKSIEFSNRFEFPIDQIFSYRNHSIAIWLWGVYWAKITSKTHWNKMYWFKQSILLSDRFKKSIEFSERFKIDQIFQPIRIYDLF